MKYIKVILLYIPICAIYSMSLFKAQEMTGLQIMKENGKQLDFKTEISQMTMELINSSNKVRSRTVERYTLKDENGYISTLVRFLQPADVKDSGFLSIEYSKNDESRHLYLPALKKSRRISAGEDSDSFMGSDFTYEDLDELDFDEYSYKVLGNETVNGANCYKVEIVPIDEKRKKITGYSKRIYYISEENFVTYGIDYFDKYGVLFKKLMGSEIRLIPGTSNFYRAYTLTMENMRTKHKTILTYKNFKINSDIDKKVFSIRFLERNN